MSGYLRRLARRTLGAGVPLHSAAALPFAGPTAVVEPDVSSDTVVTLPFGQASIDAAQPAPRADHIRLSAETLPVSEKARDLQNFEVPRPPATTAGESNTQHLFTSQRLTPQSPVVHPTERTFIPLVAPSVLRRREFAPHPATRATRQFGSAERATLAIARADVAPSAPPAMRSVERERRSPLAPEPSEVHVHIGRIEVTAVPAQRVLKSAPREKPKQMSLSEYLGRRRSGGR